VYLALALQNRPRTCVTEAWDPYGSSALVVRTMMRYALESESYRGSTSAILIELPQGRNVSFSPSLAVASCDCCFGGGEQVEDRVSLPSSCPRLAVSEKEGSRGGNGPAASARPRVQSHCITSNDPANAKSKEAAHAASLSQF
jgi:hypothetical protein